MTQTIDWSKAPEGTTHFHPRAQIVIWYKLNKAGDRYSYWSSASRDWDMTTTEHGDLVDELISNPYLGPKPDIDKVFPKASRVLKYPLKFSESFTMELPEDIKVIRVDNDEGILYLCGITALPETKTFSFKASKTGGDLGDLTGYDYIGFVAIHIQMELGLYYFMKGE